MQRASELAAAIESAAELADVIELRLDYLDDNERETGAGIPARVFESPAVLSFLPFVPPNRADTLPPDLRSSPSFLDFAD